MRITALLTTAVLLLAPGIVSAECQWGHSNEVTMSCADGTTWDAQSASCIPTATS